MRMSHERSRRINDMKEKKKRLTQPADPVTSFLSAKYMASGSKITTLAIQNRQLIRLMIEEKKMSMSMSSGFTHPKRRSLMTIPTSNLTRSLPFPCRCSNSKRHEAEVRVMAEMTMPPIA